MPTNRGWAKESKSSVAGTAAQGGREGITYSQDGATKGIMENWIEWGKLKWCKREEKGVEGQGAAVGR